MLSETSFRDLGVSSFRGDNRKRGDLKLFIRALEAGELVKGAVLILEDFDRLYSAVGSSNYGWYQSAFAGRVREVYAARKWSFLEDLRAYCTGKIAHYKIPRYLRISDDFPMTVTGKVQKFKMREVSVAELDLSDAAGVQTA